MRHRIAAYVAVAFVAWLWLAFFYGGTTEDRAAIARADDALHRGKAYRATIGRLARSSALHAGVAVRLVERVVRDTAGTDSLRRAVQPLLDSLPVLDSLVRTLTAERNTALRAAAELRVARKADSLALVAAKARVVELEGTVVALRDRLRKQKPCGASATAGYTTAGTWGGAAGYGCRIPLPILPF